MDARVKPNMDWEWYGRFVPACPNCGSYRIVKTQTYNGTTTVGAALTCKDCGLSVHAPTSEINDAILSHLMNKAIDIWEKAGREDPVPEAPPEPVRKKRRYTKRKK